MQKSNQKLLLMNLVKQNLNVEIKIFGNGSESKETIFLDWKQSTNTNNFLTNELFILLEKKFPKTIDLVWIYYNNKFQLAFWVNIAKITKENKLSDFLSIFKINLQAILQDFNKQNNKTYTFIKNSDFKDFKQNVNPILKQKMLAKMHHYSQNGFWIQGSNILWLLFKDFPRIPNDIDLILPNDKFENFAQKFAHFKQSSNLKSALIYDYFNWTDEQISLDAFLNYSPPKNIRQTQQIIFQNQKYTINLLSLESTYFSKLTSVLWKTKEMILQQQFNLPIKLSTIEDIEFTFKKIQLETIDFEALVLAQIESSFCTNFENVYIDIEKIDIAIFSKLFTNQEILNNLQEIYNLFIKNKKYQPPINQKMVFNWKEVDAKIKN